MLPARKPRCAMLVDGCRCLLDDGHAGLHDPSYTPWSGVVNLRRRRRGEPALPPSLTVPPHLAIGDS